MKTPGPDRIPADVLKTGNDKLARCLCVLFQKIVDTGQFPAQWKEAVIIPIPKGGDCKLVNNYRGISLLDSLSKCFCRVIQNRLEEWAEQNKLIPESQFWFRKKQSVTDSLFTLSTLIQWKRQAKKPLYTIFVDFAKAFDTICHQHLWDKLQQAGINKKVLRILQSMYTGLRSAIRIGNRHTTPFVHKRGVRQGCVLSPLLFSLFIRDLDQHFKGKGLPGITVREQTIHSLMFADDVVILANSTEEVQKSLDALLEYCDKWALSVNIDKTKIMRFGRGKRETFKYNGQSIAITDQYKYLGIILSSTRWGFSYSKAIHRLCEQAKRESFSMVRKLQSRLSGKLDPETLLHVFDVAITPILTYNAEIWLHSATRTSLNMLEKISLSYCKYVLGVGKSTPTAAILGELGRYPLELQLKLKRFYGGIRYKTHYPCTSKIVFNLEKSTYHGFVT